MSLNNDLISRARLRPAELTIRPNQVRPLADQARHDFPESLSSAELAARILAGEMRFMDIPVRVIGVAA